MCRPSFVMAFEFFGVNLPQFDCTRGCVICLCVFFNEVVEKLTYCTQNYTQKKINDENVQ